MQALREGESWPSPRVAHAPALSPGTEDGPIQSQRRAAAPVRPAPPWPGAVATTRAGGSSGGPPQCWVLVMALATWTAVRKPVSAVVASAPPASAARPSVTLAVTYRSVVGRTRPSSPPRQSATSQAPRAPYRPVVPGAVKVAPGPGPMSWRVRMPWGTPETSASAWTVTSLPPPQDSEQSSRERLSWPGASMVPYCSS